MPKTINAYSPEEVADILQVESRWVTAQCRDEKFRAFKLGGRWRITPKGLLEFLRNSENFGQVEDDFSEVIEMLESLIN